MKNILTTSAFPFLLFRLAAGLIFLSEGIQKFTRPDEVGAGRFLKIGFTNPDFWAHFTGCFEIACSVLIIIGLITRIAALPLLAIMVTAFITTKIPILHTKGFWAFAHEYRTDFAMTLILIALLIFGSGRSSLDFNITNHKTSL